MQLSKKKQTQNKALYEVYAQMDLEAAQGDGIVCSGCGVSSAISHAHILSRKHHPELMCDPANIVYDCMSVGDARG